MLVPEQTWHIRREAALADSADELTDVCIEECVGCLGRAGSSPTYLYIDVGGIWNLSGQNPTCLRQHTRETSLTSNTAHLNTEVTFRPAPQAATDGRSIGSDSPMLHSWCARGLGSASRPVEKLLRAPQDETGRYGPYLTARCSLVKSIYDCFHSR